MPRHRRPRSPSRSSTGRESDAVAPPGPDRGPGRTGIGQLSLGAHMSIAGGLDLAVERASAAGCDVLQIFTKSSNQWRARDLEDEEVARFRKRLREERIGTVAAHDSYLINLASPDPTLYRRSIGALAIELRRCRRLGIPLLIVHPGAHMGSGVPKGIERIAAALDEVLAGDAGTTGGGDGAVAGGTAPLVLLETWAGQGTTIGSRFEEIAAILERLRQPERAGVCLDTCHVFAAGYEIRTEAAYEATMGDFDRRVGLDRIRAIHLNDSKGDLGCRVDRHEHIGRGWIGLEAFRLLVNDPRFARVPMYLETPKGTDLAEDRENLATLRSLVGDPGPRPWRPPEPRRPRRPGAAR